MFQLPKKRWEKETKQEKGLLYEQSEHKEIFSTKQPVNDYIVSKNTTYRQNKSNTNWQVWSMPEC